jgi:hypothetical protein
MATQAQLMKAYRPRRPGTTLDDVITPEIRASRAAMVKEARQEAKDREDQVKTDKAYADAQTSPDYAKGGVTRADGCITKGHTKGRMV